MKFGRTEFDGTITIGSDRIPAKFDVWEDDNFRLYLHFHPLPLKYLVPLRSQFRKPGDYVSSLIVKGASADGVEFSSETVEIVGVPNNAHGCTIKATAREADVISVCATQAPAPRLELWLRGLNSGGPYVGPTALGCLEVIGSRPDEVTSVSGLVRIQAEIGSDHESWTTVADEFLAFICHGLGFAQGRHLQIPRRDLFDGYSLKQTFYEGDSFSPSLAPIHPHQQSTFITALIRRFENPRPFPEVIWAALGWLNHNDSADEVCFLLSLTAIETLVADHALAAIQKLLKTIEELSLDEMAKRTLQVEIDRLKKRTFALKIQNLRDHYNLSPAVFTDTSILEVTKERNHLVHNGAGSGKHDLWLKTIFVRDFISQIVFHEIEYLDSHLSYVGGFGIVHPHRNTET